MRYRFGSGDDGPIDFSAMNRVLECGVFGSQRTSRFKALVRNLLRRVEVDKAVLVILLGRIWQVPQALITMWMISRCLTLELQGFYYVFFSVTALRSFFELGFSLVVMVVASNEWARLEMGDRRNVVGDARALSRLVSLGRLSCMWYAVASLLYVLVVGLFGYLFFASKSYADVVWKLPWGLLTLLSGLAMWTMTLVSILEGCNQVFSSNLYRLFGTASGSLLLWVSLALGGELWSPAVLTGASLAFNLLLFLKYREFFKPFLELPSGDTIDWRTEIWPMQWRLGMSGLVNYFAYSLLNPVMFHYHGPAVAGQTGMTKQAVDGLLTTCMAWVSAKAPTYGVLVGRRDYEALDCLWLRSSLVGLAFMVVGAISFLGVLYALNLSGYELAGRFLPLIPTGLFLLAGVLMLISQCESAYLRAHRQEPIVVMSVCTSLTIGLLVWWLGSVWGPVGAAAGYLAAMVMVVLWETHIFLRCRVEWHQ